MYTVQRRHYLKSEMTFVAVQLGLRPNVSQTAYIYNKRVGNLVRIRVLYSLHGLLWSSKAVSHLHLGNGRGGSVERIHLQLLRLLFGSISVRIPKTSTLPIL